MQIATTTKFERKEILKFFLHNNVVNRVKKYIKKKEVVNFNTRLVNLF